MPIASGTKLGSYEIGAPLGVGGTGEVYRARDTKLDREVAIKVLSEEFARDGERLARFEREAKLLASLNHPNVATLYGLEEHDGQKFLVMELVEGETLADRIARGPIPIDEAISLFIEIAEGLEAAHEKGIIHRDLKPANIKITPEGRAKILDFGLARLAEADTDPSGEGGSQSPTLTKGTALGAIMGTASYMSPEQARGKAVDKRTDVWAYGCCLYEALTAHKAFEGETITDILAAVVHQEPSLERVPSQVPADVKRVLRRCFKKDRRQRFHDIADVRLDLEDAQAAPFATTSQPRARTPLVAMALVTVAALGVALWSLTRSGPVPLKPRARFSMPLPTHEELHVSLVGPSVAISPDGQHFAWIARREDGEPFGSACRERARGQTARRNGRRLRRVFLPGRSMAWFHRATRAVEGLG